MKHITAPEVTQLLRTHPSWKLVDVRESFEYTQGHIEDAYSLPLSQFETRGGELAVLEGVILVCRSGGRSAVASRYAENLGIPHVYNVLGGMASFNEETKNAHTV